MSWMIDFSQKTAYLYQINKTQLKNHIKPIK
ncbi:hypothetical protein QE382_001827 [Sphingobacterium zeae]|uniref:Uncharacterized protein n=1 Tax=Sphingobacterium zeae TaxID=1776859 RepID=A0ABU0U4G3_9SPHI|nr:hypothetical protein [Sphingobacterium zeae]